MRCILSSPARTHFLRATRKKAKTTQARLGKRVCQGKRGGRETYLAFLVSCPGHVPNKHGTKRRCNDYFVEPVRRWNCNMDVKGDDRVTAGEEYHVYYFSSQGKGPGGDRNRDLRVQAEDCVPVQIKKIEDPFEDAMFMIDELTHRENTLSSHAPSARVHASLSGAYTIDSRSNTEGSDA
ncbi:hypothetical protein HPB51_021905 [Rhipicephalus microplus]|uniref:Uncharacterized protein n=1 Tax=Rhipicephalus microplus TaxID=6941 RepID=A0A9J6EIJ0_RHIMP|nr:hypothetical protein HPB51_021905 [Rhipicephalus microplus]